jgi:signal transduction histidine kinase
VSELAQSDRRAWSPLLAVIRAPVAGRTWRELLYCVAALPVGLAGFIAVLVPLAAGAALSVSVVGAVLGALLLVAALSIATGASSLFRGLASGLLGLTLPEVPKAAPGSGVLGRLEARLRDGRGWRAVAYLTVRLPLAYAGSWLIVFIWVYALFFLTYPLWWNAATRQALEPHRRHGLSSVLTPFPAGGIRITTVGGAFEIMLLALPLLLLAPWACRSVVALDTWLLRHVLTSASLAGRIRELEESRALAVDDAAARLRRVERDLHDGAQARMVAIAMTLGMAKEKLGDDGTAGDPARARELVDAAHLSAKQAVSELRDLARGIHPPVLDNGLPDALATLAAQSAVPAAHFVDIQQRPTASIESIAYFCAAELMANVGKHSGASAAALEARLADGELRLRVWDNGRGGAAATPGGGLAGLAERVRTVDGALEISSPPGGPTVVVVRLPMHA